MGVEPADGEILQGKVDSPIRDDAVRGLVPTTGELGMKILGEKGRSRKFSRCVARMANHIVSLFRRTRLCGGLLCHLPCPAKQTNNLNDSSFEFGSEDCAEWVAKDERQLGKAEQVHSAGVGQWQR